MMHTKYNNLSAAFGGQDFVIGSIVIDRRVSTIGHPAIVLMEFQTPAVMGTRIATKVLENGKRIKVDATNGVIVFCSHRI